MTSAVTTSFKELLLSEFKQSIDSATTNYYVGISRSESFAEGIDINSPYKQAQFRHALQAVKRASANSYVVPMITWASASDPNNLTNGVIDEYDNGPDTNYYVLNSLDEVFICVQTGREVDGALKPSIVEPTEAQATAYLPAYSKGRTFKTVDALGKPDGYLWRRIYGLSNLAIASFKTSDWLPVKSIAPRESFANSYIPIPEESTQRNLQDSARPGEILTLAIDDPGSNYTSPPTITIAGNGLEASFTCKINAGRITRIDVDSDNDGLIIGHGYGYQYASASVTGNAVLRPVLGPKEGINGNPVEALKASRLMLQTDFAGDEFDTILAENEFNQIGLISNLTDFGATTIFDDNTAITMKSLTLNSTTSPPTGSFVENEVIQDGGQVAKGKVVYYNPITYTLYYYQDETTGFSPFNLGQPGISNTAIPPTSGGTIISVNNPVVDAYSGKTLYINNNSGNNTTVTSGITREDTQTEDIRIVIGLG